MEKSKANTRTKQNLEKSSEKNKRIIIITQLRSVQFLEPATTLDTDTKWPWNVPGVEN